MPIVETEERYEGAFDEVECPVCGSEDWTHIVFQGVFCADCNTRCLLREPAGDQGFIAEFDGKYTWLTDDAEMIPETEEYGATASGSGSELPAAGTSATGFRPQQNTSTSTLPIGSLHGNEKTPRVMSRTT